LAASFLAQGKFVRVEETLVGASVMVLALQNMQALFLWSYAARHDLAVFLYRDITCMRAAVLSVHLVALRESVVLKIDLNLGRN
jgi:hypothetical protein